MRPVHLQPHRLWLPPALANIRDDLVARNRQPNLRLWQTKPQPTSTDYFWVFLYAMNTIISKCRAVTPNSNEKKKRRYHADKAYTISSMNHEKLFMNEPAVLLGNLKQVVVSLYSVRCGNFTSFWNHRQQIWKSLWKWRRNLIAHSFKPPSGRSRAFN